MLASLLLTAVAVTSASLDLASAQEPVTASKPSSRAAAPAIKALNPREAAATLATFKAANKDKDRSLTKRLAAIEALGKGSHQKLIKPLQTAVKKERQLTVRRAAAKALGHQPEKPAHKVIVKLLKDREILREPQLTAELIGSLSTAGYRRGKDWDLVEGMFEKDFASSHVAKQRAIIELAKAHAEVDAVDLLIRHIDEPAPVDPEALDNPPAEYWKARWHAWQAWREPVSDALFTITGLRFSTQAEARARVRKKRKTLK